MAGFSLSIVELRPHRVDEAVDSKPPPDGGSIARRGRESEMVVSTQKPFTLRVALVDGQGLVVHADVHVPLKVRITTLYQNALAHQIKLATAFSTPCALMAMVHAVISHANFQCHLHYEHAQVGASTSQQPDIDSLVASTHDLLTEFGSD
eukprot:535596-Pleurochrysis_carterae.AAC.4